MNPTGSHATDKRDLSFKRRYLREQNKRYPAQLVQLPSSEWPYEIKGLVRAWRSKNFLVMEIIEQHGHKRLSLNRTEMANDGRWKDGITWEELMEIKRQCGYENSDAVEVFPADRDIVNVANMRHLWIVSPESVPFAWRIKSCPPGIE